MNKAKLQQTILLLYNEDRTIVNDEVRLLEQVWLKYGWDENKSLYDNMVRMPRAESVARRRRELHQLGLIEYSDDALKLRTDAYNNEIQEHRSAVSWL